MPTKIETIKMKNGKTRRRVSLDFTGESSRTKQAFKDECDVNQILAKYNKTQQLNHVNSISGHYGDFTNATDYQTSLNAVMDANERFMGLSAQVRAKFNNNPAQFIDFMSNDQNYEEALNLGLLDSQKAQAYLEKKSQPQSQPTPPKKGSPKSPQNDD